MLPPDSSLDTYQMASDRSELMSWCSPAAAMPASTWFSSSFFCGAAGQGSTAQRGTAQHEKKSAD
jgi:hypothetical protein